MKDQFSLLEGGWTTIAGLLQSPTPQTPRDWPTVISSGLFRRTFNDLWYTWHRFVYGLLFCMPVVLGEYCKVLTGQPFPFPLPPGERDGGVAGAPWTMLLRMLVAGEADALLDAAPVAAAPPDKEAASEGCDMLAIKALALEREGGNAAEKPPHCHFDCGFPTSQHPRGVPRNRKNTKLKAGGRRTLAQHTAQQQAERSGRTNGISQPAHRKVHWKVRFMHNQSCMRGSSRSVPAIRCTFYMGTQKGPAPPEARISPLSHHRWPPPAPLCATVF